MALSNGQYCGQQVLLIDQDPGAKGQARNTLDGFRPRPKTLLDFALQLPDWRTFPSKLQQCPNTILFGQARPTDQYLWIKSRACFQRCSRSTARRHGGEQKCRKGLLIKYSLPGFDRPLFNKTGIPGLFDFHLDFSPDEPTGTGATPADVAGPSISTALERQLGLKLEPAKGLGDFLVIDQVQKPSAN